MNGLLDTLSPYLQDQTLLFVLTACSDGGDRLDTLRGDAMASVELSTATDSETNERKEVLFPLVEFCRSGSVFGLPLDGEEFATGLEIGAEAGGKRRDGVADALAVVPGWRGR